MEGVNTHLNEKNFAKLISNIFKKEFHNQKQSITKIISRNFQIIMKDIKKSQHQINDIKHEITELKKKVDFTESVLKQKV